MKKNKGTWNIESYFISFCKGYKRKTDFSFVFEKDANAFCHIILNKVWCVREIATRHSEKACTRHSNSGVLWRQRCAP